MSYLPWMRDPLLISMESRKKEAWDNALTLSPPVTLALISPGPTSRLVIVMGKGSSSKSGTPNLSFPLLLSVLLLSPPGPLPSRPPDPGSSVLQWSPAACYTSLATHLRLGMSSWPSVSLTFSQIAFNYSLICIANPTLHQFNPLISHLSCQIAEFW